MHLRRFLLHEFIKPTEIATTYPEMPGAYKVCGICANEDPASAELLAHIAALSQPERNCFRNGMSKLLKVANKGLPLQVSYDEKQCHETHAFTYAGEQHLVWRIRTNDMRILFYYGSDKTILIIDTFPKHAKRLTNAQKSYAEATIKRYLNGKPYIII